MGPSVFIFTKALEHNLRHLIKVAAGRPVFPVIKANAYGHDAVQVALFLSSAFSKKEVPMFCVARSTELLPLWNLPIERDFLILSQVDWDWHLSQKPHENIVWTIASKEDLEVWQSKARGSKYLQRAHLKINTGMNRLGFSIQELKDVLPLLKSCLAEGLLLEGIYTHFWNSDDVSDKDSKHQVEQFAQGLKILEAAGVVNSHTWIHAENSAALRWKLSFPGMGRLAFRPGIHLWGYGLDERYSQTDESCKNLIPALAVGAPIRQLRELKQGEGLSYAWRFRCSNPSTWIASVPLGYADGIPRSLSWDGKGLPKAYLIINQEKCPIVSTVTMDMVMVEVSKNLAVAINKNKNPTYAYWIHPEFQRASNLAQNTLNTITYEVLTMISSRIPRVVKNTLEEIL